MLEIIPIPAFNDNYIWVIINTSNQRAVVIDPGDAKPVLNLLNERQLRLEAILITHHHWDHTDGVTELCDAFSVPVYGPQKEATTLCTHSCHDGDHIALKSIDCQFSVFDIPGHTAGHIAFFEPNHHWLFCGDTLFAAGCGRVFEGTTEQMYQSLSRLAKLPAKTKVFCAHEYTLSNLHFAQVVEPTNLDIKARIRNVDQLRANDKPSLPSTIELELKTNPFLRCHQQSVINSVTRQSNPDNKSPALIFKLLRKWKDQFKL